MAQRSAKYDESRGVGRAILPAAAFQPARETATFDGDLANRVGCHRRRLPDGRRSVTVQQRGVTLIEMLVVATIIALFAGVVGIRYFKHVGQAKVVAASQQLELFDGALGLYKLATGAYPTNEQGLAALRVNPGVTSWNGPYIAKDLPLDPWGHPYVYRFPGEHSPDPEIISYGADGKPGGEGEDADIVSWKVN